MAQGVDMQRVQFQRDVDVHEQVQEMQHPLVGDWPKETSDTSYGEVGEWGARMDEEPGGEGTERGKGCIGSRLLRSDLSRRP